MKREEIKTIFPDATDEQLKAVMDLNGTDVEKVKAKVTALEAEAKDKKEAFDKLNSEFEALKSANASGEDWKAKFEALQAENVAKEKQAEADRIAKEKEESDEMLFNEAVGEKKFSHEAVRNHYFNLFRQDLAKEENKGKSAVELVHARTKDDPTAFTGVTAVKLAGGRPQGVNGKTYSNKAEIMAIKNYDERVQAIANNKQLFVKGDN